MWVLTVTATITASVLTPSKACDMEAVSRKNIPETSPIIQPLPALRGSAATNVYSSHNKLLFLGIQT
ncbi:hypothetical protein PBY51_002418 [Eleginops maclovinus]|uniref:Uncharacterized protein n=1 Tax=Eleginops maclovinus TaxID=56733 RepID=A0AAN7XEM3_ELEMC|nr:hypothetical protein PBY51_002418 [Eleginops maclovinus]